jgi:TonB family protein
MRPVFFAALVLTPVLLHAQAITPAQSKSSAAPALQARLVETGAFAAPAAAAAATTPKSSVRVSTGFTAPKLIHSVDIASDANWQWHMVGEYRTAVVGMVVDQTGKPTNLKIVQSAGVATDYDVLAAVSKYRFTPGSVSNQAVTTPVELNVKIMNPLMQ